ncbi:tsukushi [Plectropomus leopardus]|uniref:tsukushi n=1 Tax=Plectropomus leopardus TaxID=160734 RepID=UPI001C4D817C|nr:tsukushi [Plectropomus leopardus]XP_042343041.1 tsukushi [Plectropomus leopardus]XP_042343042.1 tsukushi [Plectropomus leopardus]XP_042343043.1 tsukushi [Plectropomus leopardus]XP_042343044.1 tsukushi [Plectropomus leopardus]
MALLLWLGLLLLASVQSSTVKNCYPGCHCEVESFGLFNSFSLTRVDCRGLGPGTTMPIPIPLDTAHLDLSSNAMGPLGDTMLAGPGYTTLISLDLSSNFITTVTPNALSKLRYLETLDLSHNNLDHLSPSCFSGLPLAEVDLSHNSFREFDLDVFTTKINGEPVSVDLSHNKLVSVSTTLHGRVLHIQSLNLSANWLSSVPRLAGLPLRYLNLDGNPITHIKEGAFAQLKDLVYLSASGLHELQEIEPYSFKGLQSLQVLDLSNNAKLKTLSPAVFSGLDSLQELNLSGSGVVSLPNNMLTHLPSIKSITLGRNIHCWRTQKQGQFHRQLGQVQHNEVLNCNVEGIVL